MKNTKVADVMSMQPYVIDPEATLRDAAIRMEAFECGALPVEFQGKLVGIITDRDIVIMGLAEDKDPDVAVVGEIMATDVFTCKPTDSLLEAADFMADQGVRRLVVVDEHGGVKGLVSISDMLKRPDIDKVDDDVVHHLFKYA